MEHENQQPEKTRLPVATIAAVVVVIAIIVALALYLFGEEEMPEPPPTPAPTQPAPPPDPQPEPEPEPEPEPAPEPEPEPEPEPLPSLDESDEAVLEHTRETVADPELAELLVSDEILRKFVRAVNAADEGKVVHEYRPMVSPPPPLEVEPLGESATEAEQEYRLSEENYDRYDRYVELLAEADPAEVARQYEYFLPLLETAFQEHGVDKGSFHEVLIDAIDEVLAAPEPRRDLVLVRPKVFYEYKDPELEELPATHKLMLRMGPEHSRRVKQSLRQLRTELQKVER